MPSSAALSRTNKDASWVRECQEDKIYVKADRLMLTDAGIFLIDEANEAVSLSALSADSNGIYIARNAFDSPCSAVYPIVWGESCQAWRTVNIQGKCVVCGKTP